LNVKPFSIEAFLIFAVVSNHGGPACDEEFNVKARKIVARRTLIDVFMFALHIRMVRDFDLILP
jgi:hypothetical protein